MKMSKDGRDSFVKDNYNKLSNKKLAEQTGWSLTTIKSVKVRLGLVKKNSKRLELESYCVDNYPRLTIEQISIDQNTKVDNVRDTLKLLGLWSPQGSGEASFYKRFSENFLILSKYRGAHGVISLQCKRCGKEHTKRANNFVSIRFKCCSIEKPKLLRNNEKVVIRIIENSAIVACIACNNLRKIKLSMVNNKAFTGKCISCSSKNVKTKRLDFQNAFLSHLKEKELELLEQDSEVITRTTEVVVKYPDKGIRTCSARNIFRYGFKNDHCILYLMDFGTYGVKIGVSNDPEYRAKKVSSSGNLPMPVIEYLCEGSRSYILRIERELHSKLSSYSIEYGSTFTGSTEFFNNLKEVRDLIANYLLSQDTNL